VRKGGSAITDRSREMDNKLVDEFGLRFDEAFMATLFRIVVFRIF
jgi:hypothetical protein